MREILFRGKRVDNGTWAYGDLLYCDDEMEINNESHGENGGYIIPETVGQYTGLCDKNGTRIFEGDIIRDEDGDIMAVKWQTEGATFVLEPKPYVSVHFYSTLPSKIEIIGNIHDDPELLEG